MVNSNYMLQPLEIQDAQVQNKMENFHLQCNFHGNMFQPMLTIYQDVRKKS